MAQQAKSHVFDRLTQNEITDEILHAAAEFHGNHYGVWAADAPKPLLPGKRVKFSPERLKAEFLPAGADTTYISVEADGTPVGHVFARRWKYGHQRTCWITQLVMHREHRERGLAGMLLRHLRSNEDQVVGIMSSHSFACAAAVKAFGCAVSPRIISFMGEHVRAIIEASPIKYVREAQLRGQIFGQAESSSVSSAFTNFFVDYAEPLEALERLKAEAGCLLGQLFPGHEFLLCAEVTRGRLPLTGPPRPEERCASNVH